jgi:hypothetical protein
MRYAKRDAPLEGMPKKTAYQAAFGAQRRAIHRVASRTMAQRTLTQPYIDRLALSPDETGALPTSETPDR